MFSIVEYHGELKHPLHLMSYRSFKYAKTAQNASNLRVFAKAISIYSY